MHPDNEEAAKAVFEESGIIITTDSKRHLRANLESDSFIDDFVHHKVDE